MFHRQLLEQVNSTIITMPALQPLTVLDLGCGDAALFSNLLTLHNVALYVGYDTSAEVLQYAAASLKHLPAKHRLVNDYLQHATKNETQSFNLIYSSFAIHHLKDEQKIKFFKEVYDRLLAPCGVFIYVDVFKSNGQSRDEYLNAYLQNMAANWTALTSSEFELVEGHIREYDFPAEKAQLTSLLTETGFFVKEPVGVDAVHSVLVLRK